MLSSIFLTILIIAIGLVIVGYAWNKNYDFFLLLGSLLIFVLSILMFADGVEFVNGSTVLTTYNYTTIGNNTFLNSTLESGNRTYYNFSQYPVAGVNVGWMLSFSLFFVSVFIFFSFFFLRVRRRRLNMRAEVAGEDED